MSETYEILDMHKHDPSKKNIILFLLERNIGKGGVYLTYKYILNTVKVLQKDFNVFLIPKVSSKKETWLEAVRNTPIMEDCIYINLDKTGHFMKAETTGEMEFYDDRKTAYNYTFNYMQQLYTNLLQGEPWIFENMAGTITSAMFLPYERNHEIIPTDERSQKLLDGAERTAMNRMSGEQQFFSFRMMSQRNLYPFYFLLRLMKEYDVWHYSFTHDTTSIWYPWVKSLNPLTDKVKMFYFVDDKRGLRDFIKFPSAEIQEAFGSKMLQRHELTDIIEDKKHDFIFGGTFPYDVGYRLNDWTRFFDKLDVDATIRTQTDGMSTITGTEIKDPMETKKFKGKKIKDEAALDVIRSISTNKNVKPTVEQDIYHEEQKDYRFTIILKCFYGKFDSLNFRIYSSLANGVIPLIANDYDVDNLQIPEKFKDMLTVYDNKDIELKVEWAKERPEEYIQLFWDMYDYYVRREHFKENWYHSEFKNDYFKEMY